MKAKLIIFFLFTIHFFSISQSWDVQVLGTIKEMNGPMPIENVMIVLFVNNNPFDSILTNINGNYSFNTYFSIENEYAIQLKYRNTNYDKTILHNVGDTMRMDTYILDMSIFKGREERFDPSAYYDLNDTKNVQNFEFEWFKDLFDDYSKMCVKFVQVLNPQESKKVAKKRMKTFIVELKKINCDMTRISYSNEVKYLDEEDLSEDPRSRIQGVVISMDGDCNKKSK